MNSYLKYIQTPKGRAARQRALANWNEKRRQRRQQERDGLPINPEPLVQVLAGWRPDN